MKQVIICCLALVAIVNATAVSFTCPVGSPNGYYCLEALAGNKYWECSLPDFSGSRLCAPGTVCTGLGYHATNPCKAGGSEPEVDPCVSCTLLPTIVAPTATSRQCGASLDPSITGEPTVSAPCGSVSTVTYSDSQSPAGACHTGTTVTRTWTVTDSCGRTKSATQTISLIGFTCPQAHANGFWCQHSEYTNKFYECSLPFWQGWRDCPVGTQCVNGGFQTGVPCLTGPLNPSTHYCGDGNCDSDETCFDCPADCPAALPSKPEDFTCAVNGFYCFGGDHNNMYYECSLPWFQGWRPCPTGTFCSTQGFNGQNPCTTQEPVAQCSAPSVLA